MTRVGIRYGNFIDLIGGDEGGNQLYAGRFFPEGLRQGKAHAIVRRWLAGDHEARYDPIDAIAVGLKFVKAEIVRNDQEDDQRGGDADGQPQYVDQRKRLVTPKMTEGDEEVVFQHVRGFLGAG